MFECKREREAYSKFGRPLNMSSGRHALLSKKLSAAPEHQQKPKCVKA